MPWITRTKYIPGYAGVRAATKPDVQVSETSGQATAQVSFPFKQGFPGYVGRAAAAADQMANYLLDVGTQTHTKVELKPAGENVVGATLVGAIADVNNAVQLLNFKHANLQNWAGDAISTPGRTETTRTWIHDGSW